MSVLARQCARYPDVLPDAPDESGLSDRDAALAHAIYDASVRRWITISHLVGGFLSRPIDQTPPAARAALLAGTAQLLLLDRVPDHAALHTSVEWVKHSEAPRASGMVNAVLRRVLELRTDTRRERWTNLADELPLSDGSALVLNDDAFPAEPVARAALAAGIPARVMNRWRAAFGPEKAIELARHGLTQPPTVLRVGDPTAELPSEDTRPHQQAGASVWTGSRSDLSAFLRSHPDVWAQDAAAMRPVRLLRSFYDEHRDGGPERIVDLCAGRGTKTRQLRALFPNAQIVACEVTDERLAALRTVFENDDRVTVCHAEQVGQHPPADAVLLDVPCSNSGVIARRAEARHRIGTRALARLTQTQREIMGIGDRLLVPARGVLLYATCSLEREENEDQARWATDELGLEVLAHERTMPRGEPGGDQTVYHDGSFAAVLGSH